MKPFANILAILSAIALVDGHWFAMQSITWVEMAQNASRSETTSVPDILTGKVVCEHCDAITDGKETEGNRVIDYLSQARLLAPLSGEAMTIPPRASSQITWPSLSYALDEQATSGVLLPPPLA